jgi:hypothetical protein
VKVCVIRLLVEAKGTDVTAPRGRVSERVRLVNSSPKSNLPSRVLIKDQGSRAAFKARYLVQ